MSESTDRYSQCREEIPVPSGASSIPCVLCSKKLRKTQAQDWKRRVKRGQPARGPFCSMQCAVGYGNEKSEHRCTFCGKFVSRQKYKGWEKARHEGGPFCSEECMDGHCAQKIASEYPDSACVICGKKLSPKRILHQGRAGRMDIPTCKTVCSQTYATRNKVKARKKDDRNRCTSCGRVLKDERQVFCDNGCVRRHIIGTLEPEDLSSGKFDRFFRNA